MHTHRRNRRHRRRRSHCSSSSHFFPHPPSRSRLRSLHYLSQQRLRRPKLLHDCLCSGVGEVESRRQMQGGGDWSEGQGNARGMAEWGRLAGKGVVRCGMGFLWIWYHGRSIWAFVMKTIGGMEFVFFFYLVTKFLI
jgi:hypothetical protein